MSFVAVTDLLLPPPIYVDHVALDSSEVSSAQRVVNKSAVRCGSPFSYGDERETEQKQTVEE
ncbi:hypothetical protein OUZ56_004933 [Daphnia magna]|uniref:Uncharacterized protein n=1 Tax=Daphnia magna TaxID=35525 RepID=A0ABQ9YRA6_9CRUS|nr:hypothetical protein OUZ56_004933 [Daphnia magna]